MKKSDKQFEWTEEADAAFSQLKKVLSTPPVLVAPKKRAITTIHRRYIPGGKHGVSRRTKRRRERRTGVQRLVYFLSEVLSPSKQRYPHYQKLAYSVFTIARKLRQYFAVHPIIVVNEAPLTNILMTFNSTNVLDEGLRIGEEDVG
jgi:hypothetical protein